MYPRQSIEEGIFLPNCLGSCARDPELLPPVTGIEAGIQLHFQGRCRVSGEVLYVLVSAKRALIFPSYTVQSITTVAFPLSAGTIAMSSAFLRLLMAFCSARQRLVGGWWGAVCPTTATTTTTTPRNPDQDTPTAFVTLPYIRHLSETIRRILSPLGIRTCFRPHCTLRQTLVRVKNSRSPQQRPGVVYRIPCGTCPKVYIGQTGRTLEHRLKEHKRALTSGNVFQSAVAEHAMDESHAIKWEEAEVVDHHPHYQCRSLWTSMCS